MASEQLKSYFISITKWLALFLLLISSIVLVYSLTKSQPLVHDEAVYLTEARSWMSDAPASEFRVYRPIGLAVIGWILLHFTDSDQSLRLIGIVFAFFTTLFLFLLVNSLSGVRAAILSVLLMLSSGLFLQNAPNFLNDVPSSGFIFGILWVLWRYFQTAGKSKLIFLLPALIGLAFYLRYGTVINFAAIGFISMLLFWKKFSLKENKEYSGIIWSILITLIVLIPFFYISISTGNGLTGVLSRGGGAAGRKFLGEGLIDYIKYIPYELGGWAFGFFILLGVIFTVVIPIITKIKKESHLGIFWVGSIAMLHLFISGLLVHAEPRYIFFSATILASVGAIAFIYLIDRMRILSYLIFIFVISIVFYFGVGQYEFARKSFDNKFSSVTRASYVVASDIIKKDNPSNKECAVWSVALRPEISWYSHCYTLPIREPIFFYKDYLIHLRRDRYAVTYTNISELQIDNSTADEFGVTLEKIYQQKTNSSLGDMIIYRLNKNNPIDSKLREEMMKASKK